MKSLADAVFHSLSNLYGAENTFNTYAESAAMPYQVFTVQPSGPGQYHACDRDKGTMYDIPILFHVYSTSSVTAYARIDEIVETFHQGLPMDAGKCVGVSVVSRQAELEPDRDSEGRQVWHGTAIIEFKVTKE